jgi:hypothetical protein
MYHRAKIAFALIVGVVSIYIYSAGAPKTAPAFSTEMDGSTVINCNASTPLFNGAVPPHGFMVQSYSIPFFVNDNGPASFVSPYSPNSGSPVEQERLIFSLRRQITSLWGL